jgi:hypothetical protein
MEMSTLSKEIQGTDGIKMNWFDYWIGHCWMTGWQSIRGAYRIWADLMGSNYKDYALPRTAEDPEQECLEWFWVSLGEDDTYPREFLEYLMQMAEDVKTGKTKTYPIEDLDKFFDELKEDLDQDE